MEKQRVTLRLKELPLEAALQMMAPVPYVITNYREFAPRCREIFLNAYNERPPYQIRKEKDLFRDGGRHRKS